MSVSEAASGVGDESVESTELAPGADGFHLEPRCRICRNDQVRTKVNDLLADRGQLRHGLARSWGRERQPRKA
jgi:hypothetical protein